jgi:hypothetical protein
LRWIDAKIAFTPPEVSLRPGLHLRDGIHLGDPDSQLFVGIRREGAETGVHGVDVHEAVIDDSFSDSMVRAGKQFGRDDLRSPKRRRHLEILLSRSWGRTQEQQGRE